MSVTLVSDWFLKGEKFQTHLCNDKDTLFTSVWLTFSTALILFILMHFVWLHHQNSGTVKWIIMLKLSKMSPTVYVCVEIKRYVLHLLFRTYLKIRLNVDTASVWSWRVESCPFPQVLNLSPYSYVHCCATLKLHCARTTDTMQAGVSSNFEQRQLFSTERTAFWFQ